MYPLAAWKGDKDYFKNDYTRILNSIPKVPLMQNEYKSHT